MLSFRVIARLDIKGANLIKGFQMEGLRVLGKPAAFAERYAAAGADELIYLDTVASLYGRNNLETVIEETARNVFVPISVGGGVRSCDDARRLLRSGADKITVNTAALREPAIIGEISQRCGKQAICVSIEAKRTNGHWEAFADCGRERSGRDAVQWAHEAASLGAGEILLTSIDRDGTESGPDVELAKQIKVDVPVILAGGIATAKHAAQAAEFADAIAIGTAFHYGRLTIGEAKAAIKATGKEIREC